MIIIIEIVARNSCFCRIASARFLIVRNGSLKIFLKASNKLINNLSLNLNKKKNYPKIL